MHPHQFHPPPWPQTVLGLAAVAAWLLATLLFAGHAKALHESLETERLLLGAAGWICGLGAIAFLARLLRH